MAINAAHSTDGRPPLGHTARSTARSWFKITTLAAGAIAGALISTPVEITPGECPPSGEGRGMCVLQHGWGRVVTIVAIGMLAAHILNRIVWDLPRWISRRNEAPPPGVAPRRSRRETADPLSVADHTLHAASWAQAADGVPANKATLSEAKWKAAKPPAERRERTGGLPLPRHRASELPQRPPVEQG